LPLRAPAERRPRSLPDALPISGRPSRSGGAKGVDPARVGELGETAELLGGVLHPVLPGVACPAHRTDPGRPRLVPGCADDIEEIDRKSTRLNSRHVSISYAVFC